MKRETIELLLLVLALVVWLAIVPMAAGYNPRPLTVIVTAFALGYTLGSYQIRRIIKRWRVVTPR